ncbi:unnamed protein product, partial [Effrenium voratum]
GEAMQRLQQIMPGSKLEFIPSSKWSWHLEGTDVVEEVTSLLARVAPARVKVTVSHANARVGSETRKVVVIEPNIAPVKHVLQQPAELLAFCILCLFRFGGNPSETP